MPSHAALMDLVQISKIFPGVMALDKVDLSVEPGEVHALIGENGAGKSTLMKILGGIYCADSGEIWLGGEKMLFSTPHAARSSGIGMVTQDPKLWPSLSRPEEGRVGKECVST